MRSHRVYTVEFADKDGWEDWYAWSDLATPELALQGVEIGKQDYPQFQWRAYVVGTNPHEVIYPEPPAPVVPVSDLADELERLKQA